MVNVIMEFNRGNIFIISASGIVVGKTVLTVDDDGVAWHGSSNRR